MRTSRNQPPSCNELRREFDTGALQKDTNARVRLILDDGQVYPHDGKLLFSDSTVDPGDRSGDAAWRVSQSEAVTLLPGMYVRVQIVQGIDPDALAVPQQAVRRNDRAGAKCSWCAMTTVQPGCRFASAMRSTTAGSFSTA